MENTYKRKLFIQGVTNSGKKFRPSDWAERLCCSVAAYKPAGYAVNHPHHCLIYSPYATPVFLNGEQFAMVDERLREISTQAFQFLMDFAKDNDLPIFEGCDMQMQD